VISLRLARYALGGCAAAALLAGCSESQAQTLTPNATRITPSATYGYCPALPGGTGLVPDGDFSQAPQPAPTYAPIYYKGQSFAPDWEVSKGNINFQGSGYWDVDGLCSVDLDGSYTVGGIKTEQLSLHAGTYELSFVFSGNGGGSPNFKKMIVEIGPRLRAFEWDISGGNDAQNGDYLTKTWKFRLRTGTAVLRFVSLDPRRSTYGPVIAGIVLTKT
jgi:hypothetical protein